MWIFFCIESGDDNGKWVAFLIATGYLATSCTEMVRLKVCMREELAESLRYKPSPSGVLLLVSLCLLSFPPSANHH